MGLLAFVGLLPLLTQTVPALDDLVRACEHVEIGRIESLRPIEGLEGLRIATLRVEESIWTADCADTFDFLVPGDADAKVGSVAEGDLAVWFLADSGFRRDEFDFGARTELNRIRRERGLERLAGRLDIERTDGGRLVRLPGSEPPVPTGPFEIRLWRAVFAATPRIESPSLGLKIGPDGHGSISQGADTEGIVLVPTALRSIMATIEKEKFYALPRKVGESPGPDSGGWSLQVWTSRGHHEVLVAGPPNRRSAEDVDAYARMLRIRAALPQSMREPSRRH